jgi:four helix bundle protein
MRDHTSLRAWQEAHAISIEVIKLSRSSWKPYAAALFSQLQRASLSVQLNIAEGYTFGESPTFTRHLGIAYGSAVETGELLRLALESGVLEETPLKPLLQRIQETERILLGLLKERRKSRPDHRCPVHYSLFVFTSHSSLFTVHSSLFTLHCSLFTF